MPTGAGGGAPDGETQMLRDEFDVMVERALADTRAVNVENLSPDLNRNGIPEELRLETIDEGAGQRLEIWENGELLDVYYTLSYIDRMWGIMRKEAFTERIEF